MIADIFVSGLVNGGVYALLALGFSLIFGVARIVNIAHTAFYMLAAYVAIPLTGDQGLKNTLMREAMVEVDAARAEDANEGVEDEKFMDPDWIRARD